MQLYRPEQHNLLSTMETWREIAVIAVVAAAIVVVVPVAVEGKCISKTSGRKSGLLSKKQPTPATVALPDIAISAHLHLFIPNSEQWASLPAPNILDAMLYLHTLT